MAKIYPPQLVEVLKNKWEEDRKKTEKVPLLPSDSFLIEFVEVAYHASFLTEEDRKIKFRVAFANENDLFNEYGYFDLIKFHEKRKFDIKEILKLAPATNFEHTLIGITIENNELVIWGLINIGNSWSEYHFSRNRSAILPPNLLTISVYEPGNLEVSRFGTTILKLANGELDSPIANCFIEGPIAEFFNEPFDQMLIEFAGELEMNLKELSDEYNGETISSIWGAYTGFIKCILNNIKNKKHGGSLIIIDSENSEEQLQSFKIKYPCTFDLAWDVIKKAEINLYKSYKSFFSALEKDLVTINEFKMEKSHLQELEKWDKKFMDLQELFATFSEVDGAVIIDSKLNLLGFGAEIIISSDIESVHISQNEYGKSVKEIPIESYGTRHRSVFRFCSKHKNSLGFIISQDGDVKAVTQVKEKLTLWTSIDLEN